MSYSLDLSGRVALITGASGGLGEQFAKTLARAGAAVVLASRRTDRLMALRAHIEADGGDALLGRRVRARQHFGRSRLRTRARGA